MQINLTGFPNLKFMIDKQVSVFPAHYDYLEKRFENVTQNTLSFMNSISAKIQSIAGTHIMSICEDYKWLCGIVLEEEMHFRRTGRYRLSKFKDADDQVYSNSEFMSRYMNGLLASQLWWSNHTEMLQYFRDDFVAGNPKDFSHLEIGPGHGLFLYLAASSQNCGTAQGWDISDASLANTRKALTAMNLSKGVELRKVNLFDAPNEQFKSIAFSEVLEHLENPEGALKVLHRLLANDGRIFINAPVNSPAPDHLYLFETPEQMVDLIVGAGFVVESTRFAPCTGATLERARKRKLSISAGVIARKR